jgi:excinuclease ABC subunit C
LEAFLAQHYLGQAAPPEILVGARIEAADALAAALASRAGHPVAIRATVRGTRRRWIAMATENAKAAAALRALGAASLREQFLAVGASLQLGATPERIECFDISHLAGGETVASCVVFTEAGAAKSDYRRFNIRDADPGDDYAALAEAVLRRYARVQRDSGLLPDLVLVDGGRGQAAGPGAGISARLVYAGATVARLAGPAPDPAAARRGTSIRHHRASPAAQPAAARIHAGEYCRLGSAAASRAPAAVRGAAGRAACRRGRPGGDARYQPGTGDPHLQFSAR